uniref:Uncharacterized protein n=1 Tax=Anguilla anguilla TaxID=7936 RepID=A0A0E9QWQ9_ANGAN
MEDSLSADHVQLVPVPRGLQKALWYSPNVVELQPTLTDCSWKT